MRQITYRFGEFRLSPSRFQLTRNDEALRLEKKPLELLILMATSQGQLVTRNQIATRLWGEGVFVDTEHGINTAIRKLRVALGETPEEPRFLQTVTGLGYRFLGPVATEEELDRGHTGEDSATQPVLQGEALRNHTLEQVRHTLDGEAGPALNGRTHYPLRAVTAACLLAVSVAAALLLRAHPRNHQRPLLSATHGSRKDSPTAEAATLPALQESQEQYQRGLYLFDRRNPVASAAAFRRAIELQPDYAPAYAGLAQSLDAQAKAANGIPGALVPVALATARHAIALDPNYDGGYTALGSIQTAFTWQWREAERNFATGLKLNPHNASGRTWYAVLLQSTGRREEASQQARLAVAAAPLSFFAVRMQGSILYFAHRFDEAAQALNRAQEMTPQHPNVTDKWISLVDEQRGLYDDAVKHDLLALQESVPAVQIHQLRAAYDTSGWKGYWRARLQQMSQEPMQGCRLYTAGLAYLRLNEQARALVLLRQAAEQHCFMLGMIGTDPALDGLRNNPAFGEIVHLVNADANK